MFRTCKICGKTSDITNFPKNGKYYRHYCKQCDTERVKNAIFKSSFFIEYGTSIVAKSFNTTL